MNPTANKSDFEDLTTHLRDLAYSYLEKYNPSKQQLKIHLLKKYRSTKEEKYLNSIFKSLQKLEPEEIYIITKSFTIFFYLSNIAEQVFREHFLENKNIKIKKSFKKNLSFLPVFTAHPTESSRQSTLKKIYLQV